MMGRGMSEKILLQNNHNICGMGSSDNIVNNGLYNVPSPIIFAAEKRVKLLKNLHHLH